MTTGVGTTDSPDINVLAEFLRSELERLDADRRALAVATRSSFAEWAQAALGDMATRLGISLGFLVGLAVGTYESVRDGLKSGFVEGFRKGRARQDG